MTGRLLLDGRVHIYQGDVRERLREIPDEFVHCVVTSPPYWGLRDYGTAAWVGGDVACDHRSPTMREGRNEDRAKLSGSDATNHEQLLLAHRSACGKCGAVKVDQQLGLEPTLGEHLAAMVDVFREVRRVLRKDGVCWINYGDCYATAPNGRSAADTKAAGNDDRTFRDKPFSTVGPIQARSNGGEGQHHDRRRGTLKSKDLCMVPQRLAIALQEDGWWVRSILPWLKRNAMPESIKDRPANAVEYVIMLTRSERYAYDNEAVKVRTVSGDATWEEPDGWDTETGNGGHGSIHKRGRDKGKVRASERSPRHNGHVNHTGIEDTPRGTRNFRNTDLFFSSLAEPWGLISDEDGTPLAIDVPPAAFSEAHFATFPPGLIEPLIKAGCPKGGVVLDPFGGAGTTGMVAARLGRSAILIELSAEYIEIAAARITEDWQGEEERARSRAKRGAKPVDNGPLFGLTDCG